MPKKPDLSIIITSGSQAFVAHKTLLSLKLSISKTKYSADIFLLYDKQSSDMPQYISVNNRFLTDENITLLATNQATEQEQKARGVDASSGTYVLFMRAGDLISPQYIERAITELESSNGQETAMPAATVFFYDYPLHAPRIEMTQIPNEADWTLQSVFPRSYTKSAIYPRSFLRKYTFATDEAGKTFYDWHMLCSFIQDGGHIKLIPETCQYIRRQKPDDHSKLQPFVLPASSLHTPSFMRKISEPVWVQQNLHSDDISRSRKDRIKHALRSYPFLIKATQHSLHAYSQARRAANRIMSTHQTHKLAVTSSWLFEETFLTQQIEPRVFIHPIGSRYQNIAAPAHDTIMIAQSAAYRAACNYMHHDTYDYILVVPWLIAGGADMFFMNYANAITRLRKNKRVLVISTEPSGKSLDRAHLKLDEAVDFIPLAEILRHDKHYENSCAQLLGLITETVGAQVVHVANSLLGYQFVIDYRDYLQSNNIKLIATGYNEIINQEGQRQGYVHEHIPFCYEKLDAITTDNQHIIDVWSKEYGFDPSRILLHHQPFSLPEATKEPSEFKRDGLRVLWASHVRQEKGPEMAIKVAKYFEQAGKPVTFDCYGAIDKFHYPINPFYGASSNLTYKGAFKSFFKDIDFHQYDVFLYTSLFDGTPNIVIEAGLAKLPIISSAIGGIPELVGKHATLVADPTRSGEFTQALKDMLINKELYIKKADKLYQSLAKDHSFSAFDLEVDHMLLMIDY